MNQTEFRIKAKKISELNDFLPSHTIPYDGDDTFLALAYTQNNAKQNYKISLKDLAIAINNDYGINDDNLRDKILDMIDKGELQLPAGPQGPQGPGGGSMCSCDCAGIREELDDIRKKLDEIKSILDGTSKEFPIVYDLSYIVASSSNPSAIRYNESAKLSFSNMPGYEFPDYVEVNTDYTYNKIEKSIIINPITNLDLDAVRIKIEGILAFYSLTFETSNLNYSIIENEKTSYTINDSDIKIKFTVPQGYSIPTQSQIKVSNASIIRYDSSEGELTIRCIGTGDMKVIASGQKIENTGTYYFGIVAYKVDDEGILEYDSYGNPTGVIYITEKFDSSEGTCPIMYDKQYKIFEDNEYGYGEEDVYLILPKKYLDTSGTSYKFINDLNETYNVYTGLLPIPVYIDEDSVYYGNVNGEPYAIVRIAPEGLHYQYIYFSKTL